MDAFKKNILKLAMSNYIYENKHFTINATNLFCI